MPTTTIHMVRHAQGYHNLSIANHSLHDPLLTPLGLEQCSHLSTTFPTMDNVSLVIASPMKRTLYTALNSFAPVIEEKGLKMVAVPELQETSDLPCDTGSERGVLEREFEGRPVDLGQVGEGWNSKKGKWGTSAQVVEERAREARRWLRERVQGLGEGEEVVVVSHGGFLHYLTEDWSDSFRFHGSGWANTEWRSYTFSPPGPPTSSTPSANPPASNLSNATQDDEAHLIETPASRRRRHGDEKPLDHNEATQLKVTIGEKQRREAEGVQRFSRVQAKMMARSREDFVQGYSYL